MNSGENQFDNKTINESTDRLDQALSHIPESRRAQVMENYLRDRGFKTNAPTSKPSIFKWIVIGMLGTCGLLVVLILAVLTIFSPLVKVDETTGRVELLGGAFDIQAKDVITRLSKEGSFVFGNMSGAEVLPESVSAIEIKLSTGELRIDFNSGEEINWDCDGAGRNTKIKIADKTRAVLDFSAALVDCDVSLPQKNLKITAVSAEIDIKEPTKAVDVRIERGNVAFSPEAKTQYVYTLKSSIEPAKDDFPSSTDPSAVAVSIEIVDGEISKLD